MNHPIDSDTFERLLRELSREYLVRKELAGRLSAVDARFVASLPLVDWISTTGVSGFRRAYLREMESILAAECEVSRDECAKFCISVANLRGFPPDPIDSSLLGAFYRPEEYSYLRVPSKKSFLTGAVKFRQVVGTRLSREDLGLPVHLPQRPTSLVRELGALNVVAAIAAREHESSPGRRPVSSTVSVTFAEGTEPRFIDSFWRNLTNLVEAAGGTVRNEELRVSGVRAG